MADSGKNRRRVTAANANKKQKKKKGTSGGELDKMVNRSLYLQSNVKKYLILISAVDIYSIYLSTPLCRYLYLSVD